MIIVIVVIRAVANKLILLDFIIFCSHILFSLFGDYHCYLFLKRRVVCTKLVRPKTLNIVGDLTLLRTK